ncbi:unnamed protein product [Cuscuta europaea]|uniref:Uncharacterized protein n=1 Tax=Cuscuta europaea TaxID=41803 RepID=A0A9P0YSP2_CUSEU|nr:unnamed protein product [Cuscuta europaea]
MVTGLGQIQGVPLAPLIMMDMKSVVKTKRGDKNFIYPLLLTMIFRSFDVDLENEEVEYTTGSQVLNANTMVALHYKKVGNTWIRKEEGDDEEQEVGDEEMGEAQPEPAARPRRTMTQSLDYLINSMDRMHTRMDAYETRQEELYNRFDTFETRQAQMAEQFQGIDQRFGDFTQHYYNQYGYPPPPPPPIHIIKYPFVVIF